MARYVIAAACFLIIAADAQHLGWSDSMDKQWQAFLDAPPLRAVDLAAELQSRADKIAADLVSKPEDMGTPLGDIDLVCSGGGDLNAYYLGMEMILSRVAAHSTSLRQHRRAGASGGGWIIYELALKGENRTLESYLSYGILQEAWPISFSTIATTVMLQDHHWRMMATWQANKWKDSLSQLDTKINLALSCGWWNPKLVMVKKFTSPEQAASAFISTGAISQTYEGTSCSDGSAVSGENMTPLFQDDVRTQLVVNLMETGFPTIDMGGGKFTSYQFLKLVERGQDEAVEFLRTGQVARNSKIITLCPVGSKVDTNVCKKKESSSTVLV